MTAVDVINLQREPVRKVELPDSIYRAEVKAHIVHEIVRAQLNSRRSGTADTKTRGDVAFSTRKPYRQKKTGRARMGTRRSPLLKKGGTIFGPHPRDYGFRPPAEVRRIALRSVLSDKLAAGVLEILDEFPVPEIRTRDVYAALAPWEDVPKIIFVTPGEDVNLELSVRNIPYVKVLRAAGLNCYDLLYYEHVVLLEGALPLIEERLLKR
ncbi:MAG: 50S ribosomal protein L4 [Deltaproteobacteria bacterium]|jgi:large subunit ribosomal protein L4|nr:50S ribosomal protein L4 [Deltaproteobacteria bacterium]